MNSNWRNSVNPLTPLILTAATIATATILAFSLYLAGRVVHARFDYRSKPKIQLVAPPPTCKICHCGKTSCHRECGEESMCVLRCEGLCERKKK